MRFIGPVGGCELLLIYIKKGGGSRFICKLVEYINFKRQNIKSMLFSVLFMTWLKIVANSSKGYLG